MKVTSRPTAAHAPPMKQPTEPAPNIATLGPPAMLPPSAVRLHALVWKPQARWRLARLPEDVDWHSSPRVPVPADPQPRRFHFLGQPLSDAQGDVLVKSAMVPK